MMKQSEFWKAGKNFRATSFYYLDFLYGKYKLCRLDKDADIHMLQFVHHFEGRHYIKEAYQKLYWYELIFKKDVNKQKLYFEK